MPASRWYTAAAGSSPSRPRAAGSPSSTSSRPDSAKAPAWTRSSTRPRSASPTWPPSTPAGPHFVPAALGRGLRAMLAFQLFADPGSAGALNLYADTPHAFGQLSHEVGALYASHAAIALAGAQQAEHLSEAVATRDLIGRAKGVLMQRHHIAEDEAFRLLVRSSNDLRIKLSDLAARVSEEAATDADPIL